MITRHRDKAAAYKDREYWFKQGYDVAILQPSKEDKFYTVCVSLPKLDLRSRVLPLLVLTMVLGVVLWLVLVALVMAVIF